MSLMDTLRGEDSQPTTVPNAVDLLQQDHEHVADVVLRHGNRISRLVQLSRHCPGSWTYGMPIDLLSIQDDLS